MQNNTSTSDANNYQDIGAFWDEHDATEIGEQTEVEFDVVIQTQHKYFPLDNHLAAQIKQIAKTRGISEQALLNQWVNEKINQQ